MSLSTAEADLREEARTALLNQIKSFAPKANTTGRILELAEAYAYVASPNNSHGGTSKSST